MSGKLAVFASALAFVLVMFTSSQASAGGRYCGYGYATAWLLLLRHLLLRRLCSWP